MPLNLAKRWECCGIGGADPLVRAGRHRPAFGTTVSVPGGAQEADGGVVPRGDPRTMGSAPQFVQMFGSGKNKCPWPILAAPPACTLFHIAAGLEIGRGHV